MSYAGCFEAEMAQDNTKSIIRPASVVGRNRDKFLDFSCHTNTSSQTSKQ